MLKHYLNFNWGVICWVIAWRFIFFVTNLDFSFSGYFQWSLHILWKSDAFRNRLSNLFHRIHFLRCINKRNKANRWLCIASDNSFFINDHLYHSGLLFQYRLHFVGRRTVIRYSVLFMLADSFFAKQFGNYLSVNKLARLTILLDVFDWRITDSLRTWIRK